MLPKNIKALQEKSRHLGARVIPPGRPHDPFLVMVESSDKLSHMVRVWFRKLRGEGNKGETRIDALCTCPWSEHGGVACSHVIAALNKLAERRQSALSFWLSPEDARRQKHRVFQLGGANGKIWITSRNVRNAKPVGQSARL